MRHMGTMVLLLALAATGAGAQTVPINGMEMHYEVRGTGDPLVLIHPFGACTGIWSSFADTLATKYRLILVDLRGHGSSTNPSKVFTHRQAALDLLALLDHLGISRFKAMGMSSGGMTLLHAATMRPDRVEAMVLISATTSFPEQARAILRHILTIDSLPPDVRGGFLECAPRGMEQVSELVAQFHGFADNYEDMNFTAATLGAITARTLIIHGDRDEFFPVEIPLLMYRSIPHSALWIVPGGKHLPVFQPQGHGFPAIAMNFLEGQQH